MSNVAAPNKTVGDVIAILETDPGVPNYHGDSPQDAQPPFRVVVSRSPVQIGQSMCAEDWGKLVAHYAVMCYGKTVGQAEALRGQTMDLAWGSGWGMLDDGLIVGPDPTPAPPQYFAAFEIVETPTSG